MITKDTETGVKETERAHAITEVGQLKGAEGEVAREKETEGLAGVAQKALGVGREGEVGLEIGALGLKTLEKVIEVDRGKRKADRRPITFGIIEVESGREVDHRRGEIQEVIQKIGDIVELRAERKVGKLNDVRVRHLGELEATMNDMV